MLRAVKDDRERQLENISRIQNDQILAIEQEKSHMDKETSEEIIKLKVKL